MIDSLRSVQPLTGPVEPVRPASVEASEPVTTAARSDFSDDSLHTSGAARKSPPLELTLPSEPPFQTVIRAQGSDGALVKLAPALGLGVGRLTGQGVSALGVAGSMAAAGAGLYAGDWAARALYPGQEDKRKHALVGGVISGVGGAAVTAVTKNRLLGALAGIALGTAAGAAKEIYDKTSGKGTPDVRDFYATALGAVTVGVTLTIPFR
jgi:hypothetical protein